MFTGSKDTDSVFFGFLFVCFVVFALEVIINSLVIDGYKFSFFFWLEIIAAISLIPDIDWMINPIQSLFGVSQSQYNADALASNSTSGTSVSSTAYTALSSFRFFKLLRIVKLYRYCVRPESTEEDEGQQRNAETAQQAAMKKELDPNELGRLLSDTTTRKILIGVLLMYIMCPILTFSNTQNVFYNGLKKLLYSGSSSCTNTENPLCGNKLMKAAAWNTILISFIDMGTTSGSNTNYNVLWLRAPNYYNAGQIEDIASVYNANGKGYYWTQNEGCSGKKVSDSNNCKFRIEEMEIVSYTPDECSNGQITGCDDLVIYTRLDIRDSVRKKSLYKFLLIIFTTVLLFFSAVSVGNDTTSIVVKPIAKVVRVVKKITDNPLKRHNPPDLPDADKEKDEEEESSNTLKTVMLEQVLYRIAKLLQMGYGKLGATIVRENMLTGEGEVNNMVPGVKIQAIFLVCRITRFADITDALREETPVFVNKFAKIIHDCADYWDGSANKNTGDMFLITWKLPSTEEQDSEAKRQAANDAKAELAIKALVTVVKIFAEMRRAEDLKAYSRHPRIRTKYR